MVDRHGPVRTAVTYANRHYIARTVGTYRCDEASAEHLALVADTLDAAGIRYAVLAATGLDRRVVVAATDRRRVLDALRARNDHALYVLTGHGRGGRPRPVAALGSRSRETALRVFEFRGTAAGELLSGPEVACTLEFWDTVTEPGHVDRYGEALEPGSLRAPHFNPYTGALPPFERCQSALADGVRRPVAPQAASPHLFSVKFPVDVVYTWVDGNDPQWLQRKKERLDRTGEAVITAGGAAACRYRPHEELRYSLRSVEMFAPWVRRIYLVTDGQVPGWLNTDHERLRVVTHRQLFTDGDSLPTFNSHAIESQLHRLPGLSEHFLYLNDDFFFGRPVEPEMFFASNGTTRFFISHATIGGQPVSARDASVMAAAKNNRDLLLATLGSIVTARFKHAPYSLRVSVLREMERKYGHAFATTAAAPFRSPTDIAVASSLYHYYAYATGRAAPGALAHAYVDLGAANVGQRLAGLLRGRGYDVFCLNETDSAHVNPRYGARLLAEFLRAYFPLPSTFERES